MKKNETSSLYPPVVAVLGHVDHGKTTLLDTIRKTNVAAREVGNITQSIGAYQIEVLFEGKTRKISFIDTPGHEAFLEMRSRGAKVADLAILVVAANEGVKPQTVESIKHIKNSKIPFIVALTKSDLPDINELKVKQQLVKVGVSLEGFGGNVPVIIVSAKMNQGIKELLEMILLVWDMQERKLVSGQLQAVVIESKLDQKKGALATVVIKSGQLKVGDEVFIGQSPAKIRAIFNDHHQSLELATPGDAVEVLGFSSIPQPGEVVVKEKKQVIAEQDSTSKPKEGALLIILKTDNLGSLEAIMGLLPEDILVLSKGSGEVTESDILLAKAQNAIIIAFNVKVRGEVLKLAKLEQVIVRQYRLIYELVSEVEEAVEGLKIGKVDQIILGRAAVLASFPYNKVKVLGVRVNEGRMALGDRVKLVRDKQEIGIGTIKSIRKQKENIKVVQKGEECGIILQPMLDFEVGDMLLSYRI